MRTQRSEVVPKLLVAGSRGIPARYGGFETFASSVASQLEHFDPVVTPNSRILRTIRRALKSTWLLRRMETPIATAIEVLANLWKVRRSSGVALILNPVNLVALIVLRIFKVKTALHIDGNDEARQRWTTLERALFKSIKLRSMKSADLLIVDSRVVLSQLLPDEQNKAVVIGYGRCTREDCRQDADLESISTSKFLLVVQRIVPENQLRIIIKAFTSSRFSGHLLIVGDPPWKTQYARQCKRLASTDPRIKLLGAVWDESKLCNLLRDCTGYIHGHAAGGTNPILIHAMSHSARIIAFDSPSNRESTGSHSEYWRSVDDLTSAVNRMNSNLGWTEVKTPLIPTWKEITSQLENAMRNLYVR